MGLKSRSSTRSVGLLGGSFDPVHRGHEQLAQAASQALQFDEMRLMPARAPWQKGALGASAQQRVEMVELAIAAHVDADAHAPAWSVERIELEQLGAGYSVDTLRALRAREPDTRFTLVLGADQFLNLHTWHQWHELFSLCNLAVAGRPGYELAQANWPTTLREAVLPRLAALSLHAESLPVSLPPTGAVVLVAMAPLAVSATKIRQVLRNPNLADAQNLLEAWLAAPVLDYIVTHQLYR
jgi:nicotinate-nucleotide adenylyltransferase